METIKLVEEKIQDQVNHCKNSYLTKESYYRGALAALVTFLVVTSSIIVVIITASYGPVRDIATLQTQFEVMNGKLDILIEKKN